MSKLSLLARKNIKEYEPKLQSNLKKIADVSGVTFEVEIDWLPFVEVVEKGSYKDRTGEIIYNWYMSGLADNIEAFCKNPIQKEAFVEAFGSAKRITFRLVELSEDEDNYYSKVKNENGTLVALIPTKHVGTNVSQLGEDHNLSQACDGDSAGLTTATRKNITEYEKYRQKAIQSLKKSTGIEFDLEIDWLHFAEVAKESRSYTDRIGEVLYHWYLEKLAEQVETICKDDMSKEAVVEACDKKVIRFQTVKDRNDDGMDGAYVRCTFDNGVLVVTIPRTELGCNIGETGRDIESRL